MRGIIRVVVCLVAVCGCDDDDGSSGSADDGGAPADMRPADGMPPAGDAEVEGDARVEGDAGPQRDAGAEVDAEPGPVDAFVDGPAPNFDGRVMGVVLGDDGSNAGRPLPGADVWLVAEANGRVTPRVRTDDEGRYEVPPTPLGVYRVCAVRGGFERACADDPVEITADSPYAVQDLVLAPSGGGAFGLVRLADRSPCARASTAFGTRLRGRVAAYEGASAEPSVEVETDADGAYFLVVPAGEYRLEARCEDASTTLEGWSPEGAPTRLDFDLDNTPPQSGALSLESIDGEPLRRPAPGQQVRVVMRAVDADDDPLTWRFVDAHGNALQVDGDRAVLTLPEASVQVPVLAEVSDGRGGYAEARQVFRAGDQTLLAGHVVGADGAAIEGALVNLGRNAAQTDAEGFFRLRTPVQPPLVLGASAEGHVRRRIELDDASAALRIVLQPLTRHVVRVTANHTLQDERGLAQVFLPEGALPWQGRGGGQVNVDLTGYDPRRVTDFPAPPVAEVEGEMTHIRLIAGMSVQITGMDGRAVALQRGQTAELSFPAPPAPEGEALPEEVLLLNLDEARGLWVAEGTARLDGQVYRAEVDHFSEWSLGLVTGEQEACVRVDVPPELLGQFVLRAKVTLYGGGGGQTVAQEWVPSQSINVVRHLPPWTGVRFEVASLTDPSKVLWTQSAQTRNPIFNPPLYFPYISGNDGCNGWVHIELKLPRNQWLDRIVNTPEEAMTYYGMIGYPPNLTLDQWKQSWGFTAEDEAKAAAFYNPQEFGLGRRAVCHTRGSTPEDIEMACCVAKYGHVGGPVVEALQDTVDDVHVGDTVCMEWSRGPQGDQEKFARFLAFTPEGNLSPITYFDTSGAKSVPGVCAHCHGRTKDWMVNDGDMGGRFVFFDVPAYEYAHWEPEWTRSAQEERLRELNAYVKTIHANQGPYADYIDSLYPQGVEDPGSTSSTPVPLPGWAQNPQTYNDAVRPNCRTCHIWQAAPMDFAEADPSMGFVANAICQGRMPNAMQPMLNVWRRLDPFLGDAITEAFGGEPCFSDDDAPQVQILSPDDGAQLNIGGFFGLELRATATDAEDGPDCCTLTWTSDRDGTLGHGRETYATLGSPGMHTITVTARDSRYRVTSASVRVNASNEPPVPEIVFPEEDFDALFEGVPYALYGRATDANQPLGVPCHAMEWTSDQPDADFPQLGCHPEVRFEGNGQRVLTLTVADAQGAIATTQRTINVPDPPLNAPPIVSILSPRRNAGYPGNQALQVRTSAVDPDASGQIQWTVSARRNLPGRDPIVVMQGVCAEGEVCAPTFDWTPGNTLGANCGGYGAELIFEATDEHGTDRESVLFSVTYPPC